MGRSSSKRFHTPRSSSRTVASRPSTRPRRDSSATRPPSLVARDGLREDEVVQIIHDLRSPLATMALETSLLGAKLAGGEQVDFASAVARLDRNISVIDRMVED